MHGTELVLCQRLGGEEHQGGAHVAGLCSSFGDRDLVAARLARCGAGGDNHRMVGPDEVDRFGLVSEQPLVAESSRDTFTNRCDGVRESRWAARLMLDVCEPAVLGKLLDQVG